MTDIETLFGLSLTKAQRRVCRMLTNRGVIGEFQNGKTASFEIFSAEYDERWERMLTKILPATFYALYALGVIEKDNSISESMNPYGRDNWYVLRTT